MIMIATKRTTPRLWRARERGLKTSFYLLLCLLCHGGRPSQRPCVVCCRRSKTLPSFSVVRMTKARFYYHRQGTVRKRTTMYARHLFSSSTTLGCSYRSACGVHHVHNNGVDLATSIAYCDSRYVPSHRPWLSLWHRCFWFPDTTTASTSNHKPTTSLPPSKCTYLIPDSGLKLSRPRFPPLVVDVRRVNTLVTMMVHRHHQRADGKVVRQRLEPVLGKNTEHSRVGRCEHIVHGTGQPPVELSHRAVAGQRRVTTGRVVRC
jgi:hypothetical protein